MSCFNTRTTKTQPFVEKNSFFNQKSTKFSRHGPFRALRCVFLFSAMASTEASPFFPRFEFFKLQTSTLGGGFVHLFYFHPQKLGKWSNLTCAYFSKPPTSQLWLKFRFFVVGWRMVEALAKREPRATLEKHENRNIGVLIYFFPSKHVILPYFSSNRWDSSPSFHS